MKDLGWEGESWEHLGYQMKANVMDTFGPYLRPHVLGSLLCLYDWLPAAYLIPMASRDWRYLTHMESQQCLGVYVLSRCPVPIVDWYGRMKAGPTLTHNALQSFLWDLEQFGTAPEVELLPSFFLFATLLLPLPYRSFLGTLREETT